MTSVKSKLSEARALIAKLKVEQDPVKRIDLSRALRIAAENLRDAVAASSERDDRGRPKSSRATATGATPTSAEVQSEAGKSQYLWHEGIYFLHAPYPPKDWSESEVSRFAAWSKERSGASLTEWQSGPHDPVGMVGTYYRGIQVGDYFGDPEHGLYELVIVDGQKILRPIGIEYPRTAQGSRPVGLSEKASDPQVSTTDTAQTKPPQD
jgi:hypothetical protein